MVKTLNENYKKNIEILGENLKRGLSEKQARQVVDNFRSQFIKHGVYNDDEKLFIQELSGVIDKHFYKSVSLNELGNMMGIEVVNF